MSRSAANKAVILPCLALRMCSRSGEGGTQKAADCLTVILSRQVTDPSLKENGVGSAAIPAWRCC